MAETASRQSLAKDDGHTHADEKGMSKTPEEKVEPICSGKDGDAGEGPVREKFQKTSLTPVLNNGFTPSSRAEEVHVDTVTGSQDTKGIQEASTEPTDMEFNDRGRPVLKGSLGNDDTANSIPNSAVGSPHDNDALNSNTRKRSRSSRPVEMLNSDDRHKSLKITSDKEHVSLEPKPIINDSADNSKTVLDEVRTPPSGSENADHEMQEAILSPRKKRSREVVEAELDREQKIAATEKTRRRRSSEEAREEQIRTDDGEPKLGEGGKHGDVVLSPEFSKKGGAQPCSTEVAGVGFSNTSASSPFATLVESKTLGKAASGAQSTKPSIEGSLSPFDSSNIIQSAGSSVSPFGSIGAANVNFLKTPASPPAQNSSYPPFGTLGAKNPESTIAGGISAPARSFAATDPSAMASAKSSGFGVVGGSIFGSSFGGGFGNSAKLTTFAAPAGNDKLGGGKPKPFGAPIGSDGDDNDSGSDSGQSNPDEVNVEVQEGNKKYHIHDVNTGEEGEQTIFNRHGKLYWYHENAWVERGVGPFKLNVTRPGNENTADYNENEAKKQARFIMRALATHRVVLNAPIFKEMKITGREGKEPTGKSIMFPVLVDGRMVSHMLKMGKEADIKELYGKVQIMQKQL